MPLLALLQIYTRVFHSWKSVALDNAWDGDSRPFIFFSLVCFLAFRDAPPSWFRCGHLKLCLLDFLKMLLLALSLNLQTCVWLVEVYWFGQCLGKRFSPISTFFSLVGSRAFRDAPHSQFWCRDLKLCLLDFLKMLGLALSQIYTRVFHLWKSVAFYNAWVKDFRPYIV